MSHRKAPPIRSLLFVPGHAEESVKESVDYRSDAVVVDLEEPKTPFTEADRISARQKVRAFLDGLSCSDSEPRYFVRVQSIASGHTFRDLQAITGPGLFGILLPKIQGAGEVIAADALLTSAEIEADLPIGSIGLYPILETAQAIRLAYDIAEASARVRFMGGAVSRFGDIHQALGYRWTPEGTETLFMRSKILTDARAAGIPYPISGMWGGRWDDLVGFRAWAEHLRNLGYYGMMLETAEHVDICHEVFSPSIGDIAYWSDLDRLAREAQAAGTTDPIRYGDPGSGEGHIVHQAHVESARKNLSWAHALGLA